jgi:antitoxin component of MazEF toxin-antitoxin module
MTRRKLDEENIRKLTRVGETSLAVTIPKEIVQKLKLRERQKVVVKLSGKNIIIKDYPTDA